MVVTGLHLIGAGLVFVLMAVIVTDVLGRSVFNHPLTGAPELVRVALVSLLFLGMAQTWRTDKHIRATVLADRVSDRGRAALNVAALLCALIVFLMLCYSSWGLAAEAWRIGEFEGAGALRVPTYPLRTLILLCSGLTSFQLVLDLAREARRLWGKE